MNAGVVAHDWLSGDAGFLVSTQFFEVDRPLYTAVELAMTDPEFCSNELVMDMCRRTRATTDLTAKRFLWLLLCVVRPEMQSFLLGTCRVQKIEPWLRALPVELDTFLDGRGATPSTPCTAASNLKYPTLDAFVTEMCALYYQL